VQHERKPLGGSRLWIEHYLEHEGDRGVLAGDVL
jgi:hypothetical protein